MKELPFPCPVCRSPEWSPIQRYAYDRRDLAAGSELTEYERLRQRVLFELWLPGADEIELTAIACVSCGFVCYAPRPSAADVDAKYRFLQLHERDIGGASSTELGRRRDIARAHRVFAAVQTYSGGRRLRILDFGGGDGRLLGPFVDAGHDCFLVDYNVRPAPGVQKVADTLDDIQPGTRFDAAICSHVLEHVAEPARSLRRLGQHLEDEGLVYGEVPVEIWRGVPKLERDPVTHVNFFTRGSFAALFLASGFLPLTLTHQRGSYTEHIMDVAVVVARKMESQRHHDFRTGRTDAAQLLRPSVRLRFRRAARKGWSSYGRWIHRQRRRLARGAGFIASRAD